MVKTASKVSRLASEIALRGDLNDPVLSKRVVEFGKTSVENKNFPRAMEHFRYAIALDETNAEAAAGLGSLYHRTRAIDRAIFWYERSLRLDPSAAITHLWYSSALLASARLDEAYREACAGRDLAPDHSYSHVCVGEVCYQLGDLDASRAAFEQALALNPQHTEAWLGLAGLALLAGDLARGWELWEERFPAIIHASKHLRLPRWKGEPFKARTLLVHSEQGLGDTIQFCRFIAETRKRGGRVILEAPRHLHKLFESLAGVDAFTAYGEPVEADCQIPMMSLPYSLGLHTNEELASEPYLRFTRPEHALPSYRSAEPGAFTIGIAWAGNPRMNLDKVRSIPLSAFVPLTKIPELRFRSLQAGVAAVAQLQETEELGLRIAHDQVEINDLTTCAAIEDVDLVVSVDTSIAHLAGALGKPTWVLTAFTSDWRWQRSGPDTPWYGSVRVFRQTRPGDWASVVEQMIPALQQLIAERPDQRESTEAAC